MIHRIARFVVLPDNLETALNVIRVFVTKVNEKEPSCLVYRSLQSKENPHEFIHYMIFDSKEAEEHHRTTPYVKEFVDDLYPLLDKEPEFTGYSVVAG